MKEQYRPSLKYGLIMGGIGVLLLLVIWSFSKDVIYSSEWRLTKLILYALAIPMVLQILGARDVKGRFDAYGYFDAFKAAFYVGLVAVILLFGFNMLFYNVLEPEFYVNAQNEAMRDVEKNAFELYKNQGLEVEEIKVMVQDHILRTKENFKFYYSNTGTMLLSFMQLIWYTILALLIAVVYRDKE